MEGASIPCHFGRHRVFIVCFDIWRFKQVNNSQTGFGGRHCNFKQHMPYLTVHGRMNSIKFVLEVPGAILWGRYYLATMCRLTCGALLLGRALLMGVLRYMLWWQWNVDLSKLYQLCVNLNLVHQQRRSTFFHNGHFMTQIAILLKCKKINHTIPF